MQFSTLDHPVYFTLIQTSSPTSTSSNHPLLYVTHPTSFNHAPLPPAISCLSPFSLIFLVLPRLLSSGYSSYPFSAFFSLACFRNWVTSGRVKRWTNIVLFMIWRTPGNFENNIKIIERNKQSWLQYESTIHTVSYQLGCTRWFPF